MYGFQIIVNGIHSSNKNNSLLYKKIECRNFLINKFDQDKCFQETDRLIVLLDGVILNKINLQQEFPAKDWCHTLERMYFSLGEVFFNQLRGSFAGVIYDKHQEKLIVFTDQLGTKFIYYSFINDIFCCSEVMGEMYNLLKEQGIKYNLSSEATKIMLTYGFMIENFTLCEQVKKIEPGSYLTLKNNTIELHRYYQLDNQETITNSSEDDIIEEIDRLFRQAVKRQFNKDNEYGYKHICSLSGGLDCRMTSFVAHDLGFKDQINCTFSQSEYLDQTVPQQIAAFLYHEWLFKSLDNGLWLYDVEEITKITGGNVLYYGSAHSNSMMKYINFENLGLLHSGQLGDVILSSITNIKDKDDDYFLGEGAYSTKFIDSIKESSQMKSMNKEIGYFYYRFLNGTNNGLQNIYNYTETLSPFMDLDFIEYCLHLPIEYRQNHYIYKKWILSKYPQAAKFKWETIGCRIDSKKIKIANKELYWSKLPKIIIRRLGFQKIGTDSKNHMNPIGFYLSNNKDLQNYIFHYFEYVKFLENKDIKQIAKAIIKDGLPMEKIQLITLLAAIKLFFND